MIERMTGGTEKHGVASAVFAMPAGMKLRYDQPDPAIADYITGYHVYGTEGPSTQGQVDHFLPGTANVRITLNAGPVSVRIGSRLFDPIPQVSLFGPTGCAMRAVTHGGIMIGFGVSALGWSRLFRGPADRYTDRIVPLAEAVRGNLTERLLATLSQMGDEREVKPALDRLLAEAMGPPSRNEDRIREVMAMIVADRPTGVEAMAAELGLPVAALRRLTTRHFGFPPKALLVRARFLRSFLRLFRAGDPMDYSVIDASYSGVPHFLRDADIVLGTTPRRFMAQATPFLDASVRARAAVLGAPTQALHDIRRTA